jgi:hypothetical protein
LKRLEFHRPERRPSPRFRCILPVVAALALISCASSPRTKAAIPAPNNEFGALENGALVYFVVDIPAARPILDEASFLGMDGKRNRELLDLTESAAAAVYPPGSPRSFLVAANGRYPKFRADLSFTFSPAWKKVSSPVGKRYWRSAREGLSVFLESRNALVSDGDPFAVRGGVIPPAAFSAIRPAAVFAGWVEDAAAPLNRFMERLEIPIQVPADRVLFAVYDSADRPFWEENDEVRYYEAILRIETPSASQAKALAAMISLIRVFVTSGGLALPDAGPQTPGGDPSGFPDGNPSGLIAAFVLNHPVVMDSTLILKSVPLNSGNVALLFNAFSVYSN